MTRHRQPLPFFAALLFALLAACASTQQATVAPPPPIVAAPAPSANAAPAAPAAAATLPALPDDILWVRDSAEYRALSVQAYSLAGRRLEELAAGRQPGTWAVALDVDETVLSNLDHEIELEANNGVFDEAGWQRWVARRSAPVLPGAVPFLERVHRMGGKIALVTNRDEFMRADTEANLRSEGVPFDLLLLRPSPDKGAKQPRWDAVEQGTAAPGVPPLEIVMWVGDNIKDFPGGDQSLRRAPAEALAAFGDRFIIIPNPLYGSWKPSAAPMAPATQAPAAPPAAMPQPAPAAPAASNGAAPADDMADGKVYVDEVRALLEKSLPAKLRVTIRGNLADGCTKLQEPQVTRQRRAFHIALPATREKGRMCTEALVPFERAVPVSITGLPSGTYTVEAGGKTDQFTLDQDN
ncbi:MAG TPA: HAD family acid phosphatase [Thermoanaerobaculia bacterium]|jgi:5'-nucleotidase (lipoprotein e(P4) family)|nr:HAD family acid phosphatase [Thermoanaerobaculia bacterium]